MLEKPLSPSREDITSLLMPLTFLFVSPYFFYLHFPSFLPLFLSDFSHQSPLPGPALSSSPSSLPPCCLGKEGQRGFRQIHLVFLLTFLDPGLLTPKSAREKRSKTDGGGRQSANIRKKDGGGGGKRKTQRKSLQELLLLATTNPFSCFSFFP